MARLPSSPIHAPGPEGELQAGGRRGTQAARARRGWAVSGVRRLTLSEWFMGLQVRAIRRWHVHNPGQLRLDVSLLREAWRLRRAREPGLPERIPWTAIFIRAVGRLCVAAPNLNRMLFHTPLGRRIVEFPYVTVNVPVRLRESDYLAACILQDADTRTLFEIAAAIAAFRDTSQDVLPIGRILKGDHNTWHRRLRLWLLHEAAYRLPWLYLKRRGGGISVSSLLHRRDGARVQAVAWGPTALTFAPTALVEEGDRLWLEVGMAVDHLVLTGDEAVREAARLQAILDGLVDEVATAPLPPLPAAGGALAPRGGG